MLGSQNVTLNSTFPINPDTNEHALRLDSILLVHFYSSSILHCTKPTLLSHSQLAFVKFYVIEKCLRIMYRCQDICYDGKYSAY